MSGRPLPLARPRRARQACLSLRATKRSAPFEVRPDAGRPADPLVTKHGQFDDGAQTSDGAPHGRPGGGTGKGRKRREFSTGHGQRRPRLSFEQYRFDGRVQIRGRSSMRSAVTSSPRLAGGRCPGYSRFAHDSVRSPAERGSAEPSLASLARTPFVFEASRSARRLAARVAPGQRPYERRCISSVRSARRSVMRQPTPSDHPAPSNATSSTAREGRSSTKYIIIII